MYTQCPHCSTAFRVTAQVLKQAAGKVRCGGCGAAFNALEFLSEEKPEVATAEPTPERTPPELTPESTLADADTPPEPPPAAMSPEQGAALRQTLGRLSDSEIELEDTGVEWRVAGDALPDDDADTQSREIDAKLLDLELPDGTTADQAPEGAMAEVFVGSESRDTLLDAELSAELELKSVDEVLSSSPTRVDEVLNDGGPAGVDSADVFEDAAEPPGEELRFDDNTGLPEDFDIDDEPGTPPKPAPDPGPVATAPEPAAALEVDLGLEDEWQDLLEEVDSDGIDATADPALGEPVVSLGPETLAAAPTVIQSEGEAAADQHLPAAGDSPDTPTLAEELEALDISMPDDEEAVVPGEELAGQMEALSLELSGLQEELDLLADRQTNDGQAAAAPPDAAEPAVSIMDELDALDIDLEEESGEAGTAELAPDDVDGSDALTLVEAGEPAGDEQQAESADDPATADDGAPDPALLKDTLLTAPPEVVAAETEHYVPPPTEEEETINRLIDQELMALAVEDEDGFASTIAIEKSAVGESGLEGDQSHDDAEQASGPQIAFSDADLSGTVETIVMEGDFSLGGDGFDDVVTEETPLPDETELLTAANGQENPVPARTANWRLIGGAVALALVLGIQAVHFSRDALATSPTMNGLLSGVYGAIGMPLTPAWDVTGWRFEATRGSTDDAGEVLSIYSRIGNQADMALPYPVISVSLTDRFEEIIGSRVLGPDDYLEDHLNAGGFVEPGTSFTAAISIESPAEDATGFKLNVCYRLEGLKLRCAIEDFK